MAFSRNILPTEAAYYTLNNATITNTTLKINAGGSALFTITDTLLLAIPKSFSFNYKLNFPLDIEPNIKVQFTFTLTDGTKQSFTVFPTSFTGNIYMITLTTKDGEYTSCTIKFTSDITCSMSLWELCPEASDSDTETIIDNVKQSLPRVLYDYNTWPFTIEQDESTVSLITCRLKGDTDIQGHFLLNFTATEQAIVTLRFYDNESEELFAPLTYDIHAGYNTIGVPHAFLTRLTGLHTFAVTAQTTVGTLSVETRGALFTIDGGYLASREIDVGLDVRDLAIKQTSADNQPEEIWLVGIDENEVLVRKRSYSDQNTNVGFDPVASIGEGIDAAIEFDGDWVLRGGASQYTIETEVEPWVFWIDTNNDLYGKHGVTSNEVPILLASGVSSIHACKGYSSILYEEQDQGLVIVYLKDNLPYYRQYQYQTTTKDKKWLQEQQLDTEQWDFVNVHRLNDYRLSFELSSVDKNVWMYTKRTYVGQSVPPESKFLMEGELECLANYPKDYDITVKALTYSYEPGATELYVTYNRLFKFLNAVRIEDLFITTGLLRYDAYDDTKSDVKKVEWFEDTSSKTTTLKLTLKQALNPTTLIYTVGVTLNPNSSPYFLVKLDDWGYAVFSSVAVSNEYDNTQYITGEYSDSYTLPNSFTGTLLYNALNHAKQSVTETYTFMGEEVFVDKLIYQSLGHLTTSVTESKELVEPTTWGIAYYDKNGQPI